MYRLLLLFCLFSSSVTAQTDREYIRNGNKAFNAEKYQESEVYYRKALSKKSDNPQALYNLGCALMMQNKMNDAMTFFTKAVPLEKNKRRRALIYHNMGEILQAGKLYKDAVASYSESLRNNPNDDETRYNLALCKYLMKNSSKNNKDKTDKRDKENSPLNQNDNRHEKGKNNENDRNVRDNKNQMSKDNAEQLLNAAIQQEKQTQEKLNKNKTQPHSKRFEKNW